MLNNPAIPSLGNSPTDFFGKLIPAALGLLLVIGVVVFLFYILLGAIDWITAGGDKGKLEGAKQKVTQAIIGIVVLLSFFAIISLVECFFGIGLRSLDVGPFSISFSSSPMCAGSSGGGGGGGGGGGAPGPGGSTGSGTACPCNTAGQCASAGITALGNDGACWTCTSTATGARWTPASTTSCPPVSCSACP